MSNLAEMTLAPNENTSNGRKQRIYSFSKWLLRDSSVCQALPLEGYWSCRMENRLTLLQLSSSREVLIRHKHKWKIFKMLGNALKFLFLERI